MSLLSSADQSIILLSLFIIYTAIYASKKIEGSASKPLYWATIGAVSFGVFSILTVLTQEDNKSFGMLSGSVAIISLLVSAFFNYKVSTMVDDKMTKYLIYGSIAAHLVVVFLYLTGDKFRKTMVSASNLRYGAISTPSLAYRASPRVYSRN